MKFVVEIECNPTVDEEWLAKRLQNMIANYFPREEEHNWFRPPIKVAPYGKQGKMRRKKSGQA